jgi:LTXXQ motif family protein
MIKLSRTAWIAIAAVTAVPATVAIAKAVDHRGGWHRMSPEMRARLDEGKLAMVKAALKLSADQEKLWAPVETQVRGFFKDRDAKIAERQKQRDERKAQRDAGKTGDDKATDVKRPDMAERLEKMSQTMSERAERMKSFSGTFKPFYASLSDEQKEVLRPLARDLLPGMGGRGHKGPRWAHGGGWDERGGHHGKGHHGGWGGRHHERGGDRGGPMMDDGGPDDDAAPGKAPTPPAADTPAGKN